MNTARIKLGEAARALRESLGLSQRAAAQELGISHVHLSNLENGRASPRADTIERYYDAWGVDLYMYAVSKFSLPEEIPDSMREAIESLGQAWSEQIDMIVTQRNGKS